MLHACWGDGHWYRSLDGQTPRVHVAIAERYLLGLCEGNFCAGGKHGREKGNGRIVRFLHATIHLMLVIWAWLD